MSDRHRLGVGTALALLRGYKVLFSPYFRGSCRFLPSCADYATEAIARYGLVRGGWLAAARLSRCHPFCAAGHDPVPTGVVRPNEARGSSPARTHTAGVKTCTTHSGGIHAGGTN